MPQNPYPLVGTLQGLPSGVQITCQNLTSGGTEQVITADDGSFIVDPANIGTYSDGDSIRIFSGSWYVNTVIDMINYPDGIIINLSKPVIITSKRISRGTSMNRGILCGVLARRR